MQCLYSAEYQINVLVRFKKTLMNNSELRTQNLI